MFSQKDIAFVFNPNMSTIETVAAYGNLVDKIEQQRESLANKVKKPRMTLEEREDKNRLMSKKRYNVILERLVNDLNLYVHNCDSRDKEEILLAIIRDHPKLVDKYVKKHVPHIHRE